MLQSVLGETNRGRMKGTGQNPLAWLAIACWAVLGPAQALAGPVTVDWVSVGDPGNDPEESTTEAVYGAVGYTYQISKFLITNTQWVEFLNAKDPTGANTLALYSTAMTSNAIGGINYDASAADGSKYSVKSGHGQQPVTSVSYYDAARFANWLQNGQGNGDTESGAYTLLGGTPTPSNSGSLVRNSDAIIALPTENEFYKAAFYDPNKEGGAGYWDYATGSDSPPVSTMPPGTPGTPAANYFNLVTGFAVTGDGVPAYNPNGVFVGGTTDPTIDYLTDVGAFVYSPSPWGTFDQSGLVWEWLDDPLRGFDGQLNFGLRVLRGGLYSGKIDYTSSAFYSAAGAAGSGPYGIRLVNLAVPEPSTLVLSLLAAVGLVVWKRRST